jgi:hypothetical protein
MDHLRHAFLAVLLAATTLNACFVTTKLKNRHTEAVPQPVLPVEPPTPIEPPKPKETKPKLSFVTPVSDMKLPQIADQFEKWKAEAPDLVETGRVGLSRNGLHTPYIRIGKKTGPKVLITACIHGDEHLSAMVSLGVIGRLLDGYLVDAETTELLQTRDIYYVPAVCPDSFGLNSRHDEGRDPNRNFTDRNCGEIQSITAITNIKKFFETHQFKSVMSCHNYGRIYIYPWGYSLRPTEQDADYKRILGEMARVSGSRPQPFDRHTSAAPYYGYEADWYHKHGAMAFVNEIGRNKSVSQGELAEEIKKNLPAFKIWIKEAATVRN